MWYLVEGVSCLAVGGFLGLMFGADVRAEFNALHTKVDAILAVVRK
jgi:hypothetical protein